MAIWQAIYNLVVIFFGEGMPAWTDSVVEIVAFVIALILLVFILKLIIFPLTIVTGLITGLVNSQGEYQPRDTQTAFKWPKKRGRKKVRF